MNRVQKYLDSLSDALDEKSDIEGFNLIENEALEVVRYADELNNYQRNSITVEYCEDFLNAIGRDLEHISGFAQQTAERAVTCRDEAEQEAEEAEAHAKECSTPSI